jgi:hypothetical protein
MNTGQKISEADAEKELDIVNAELGDLHGPLSSLDSSRSLAGEYMHRLRMAEALVARLA